ncbi:MAG: hypothetical protein N3D16_04305 [Anaerolineales bacterium]|nr:hypothetical protein [Anaerolineales bacterium]
MEAAAFRKGARTLGVQVKLDTCGYFPQVLKMLFEENLVDVVAMDVKAPPGKYAQLVGLRKVDLDRIHASIALIRNSGGRKGTTFYKAN